MLQIAPAEAPGQLDTVRDLLKEYAASLGIDLCFQGFAQELADLPGAYAPPEGRLLLASVESDPAGCVTLRKVGDGVCEMKRLYVQPQYRGREVGKALAVAILEEAERIGYYAVRNLDDGSAETA